MADYVDYDYQPDSAGGKFLNLKSKGDSIVIRLADKPMTYYVHWQDGKPVTCEDKESCSICAMLAKLSPEDLKKQENAQMKRRQTFIWPVIDRKDSEAKIYKGGLAVYLAIREFAQNSKWGDPTGYDLTITRTESSPANFYSVVPDPNKSELTKEEKEKVEGLSALLGAVTTTETVAESDLPF